MEGPTAGPDRGHVYFNGRPLCAETHAGSATTWDINASNVVCRMLGFSSATSTLSTDGCPYGGCPTETVPFAMSGFKCSGSETHITECPHDESVPSNCGSGGLTNNGADSNDIIGIVCTGFNFFLTDLSIKAYVLDAILTFASGTVVVLSRKHVGNSYDYFDKNFSDYVAGFQSKGNLDI